MTIRLKLSLVTLLCTSAIPVFSATAVDLSQQKLSYLKSFVPTNAVLASGSTPKGSSLKEISQSNDRNQTTHIRIKQLYSGYPVLGGDAIVHTPQGQGKKLRSLIQSAQSSSMNGVLYEGLQQDLQNTPAAVFSPTQADKALNKALAYFEEEVGARADVRDKLTQLMVYVDDKNKAHWVFQVKTSVMANGKLAQPSYLIDAINFSIYKHWDNHKTSAVDKVSGGGFGGNIREKFIYDGAKGNLMGFGIERDASSALCYLNNDWVHVIDARTELTASFGCQSTDEEHNATFWAGNVDEVNGGFSPNNDVIFAAQTIIEMYQNWYQIPVLSEEGKPMRLKMITHDPYEAANASWSDIRKEMRFGDGNEKFYPLTSLGITAHEISHGFTSQHSNLFYGGQSGGMNEAFSDMASQAAQFYSSGKTDFLIGSEVAKEDNFALRYMDKPSKDCNRYKETHECSIDSANDYFSEMDVHHSSGVYNHAFYLLANSEGWDVRKAFDVMVQANRYYWTEFSTFEEGACGVLRATADYKYDTQTVVNVFNKVGIETEQC